MIDVICVCCEKPLDKPGALAFGPPRSAFELRDDVISRSRYIQFCDKLHICQGCWPKVLGFILDGGSGW